MKRSSLIALIILTAASQGAFAADDHLSERQKLGRRLFEQSCGVCHTRPTLVSGMFGPELSKESAGGNEAAPKQEVDHCVERAVPQLDALLLVPLLQGGGHLVGMHRALEQQRQHRQRERIGGVRELGHDR